MKDFSRVLMVVNPVSGGRDKDSLIGEVRQEMLQRDLEFEVFMTSGEGDKEALEQTLKTFRPHRIISVGGDGTIKLLAELVAGQDIVLGIFPAGSANGLAENLDLPEDTESLLDIILGNKFIDLDTIQINGELCLHISDIGLNAALIKNYHEGNIRGKLGYLIQSIPTLINSDFPFPFTIKSSGKTIQRNAVLIAIANARRYGTGATINPQGKYDDGRFEILIFKEFNIPQILETFRENVELSEDFLEIISTDEAWISSELEIPFQIDGEYRGDIKEVHAQIAPVKIRIAVP